MLRRTLVFAPLAASCQAMNLTFDYSYFDGPARLHTSLALRAGTATLIRQAASPLGVWEGSLSATTIRRLWEEFPSSVPDGPPLAPGMPNHWITAKHGSEEKSIRLPATPAVMQHVAAYRALLETAMLEASARPVRTLSLVWVGFSGPGVTLELVAAGTQPVRIPDAAQAIAILRAGNDAPGSVDIAGRAAAGAITLAPGGRQRLTIALPAGSGKYQAVYRRQGITHAAGDELFGESESQWAVR